MAASLFLSAFTWTASAAYACDRAETTITTSPSPRQTVSSVQTSLRALAALPRGQVDTLLIGDSLIVQWPVPPRSVTKFGVSGDRVQNVLWRLDQPEAGKVQPKRVFLLIGTNNLGAGNTPCAIAAGILAASERMHVLWPDADLAVIGIPVRRDNPSLDTARRETNDIVREQLKYSRYIDPDGVLNCTDQCTSFKVDKLHLSAKGYEALDSLLIK
ncbi:GDSL-type esterase/lipase family protein [Reyranella sp.]|uniref:GDSL-type esterase/lipase family protein n=1 Tax=Reyranella sp. TaxID=1929291 RepID=UPI0025F68E68|nr:GDSL-type esterase/lipase family protein [Reyranella sp.]